MDFHAMKRKALQALCKKHNLGANGTNLEMADRLASHLKKPEAELKPKKVRSYLEEEHKQSVDLKKSEILARSTRSRRTAEVAVLPSSPVEKKKPRRGEKVVNLSEDLNPKSSGNEEIGARMTRALRNREVLSTGIDVNPRKKENSPRKTTREVKQDQVNEKDEGDVAVSDRTTKQTRSRKRGNEQQVSEEGLHSGADVNPEKKVNSPKNTRREVTEDKKNGKEVGEAVVMKSTTRQTRTRKGDSEQQNTEQNLLIMVDVNPRKNETSPRKTRRGTMEDKKNGEEEEEVAVLKRKTRQTRTIKGVNEQQNAEEGLHTKIDVNPEKNENSPRKTRRGVVEDKKNGEKEGDIAVSKRTTRSTRTRKGGIEQQTTEAGLCTKVDANSEKNENGPRKTRRGLIVDKKNGEEEGDVHVMKRTTRTTKGGNEQQKAEEEDLHIKVDANPKKHESSPRKTRRGVVEVKKDEKEDGAAAVLKRSTRQRRPEKEGNEHQNVKEGLQLDKYVNDTHIVKEDSKQEERVTRQSKRIALTDDNLVITDGKEKSSFSGRSGASENQTQIVNEKSEGVMKSSFAQRGSKKEENVDVPELKEESAKTLQLEQATRRLRRVELAGEKDFPSDRRSHITGKTNSGQRTSESEELSRLPQTRASKRKSLAPTNLVAERPSRRRRQDTFETESVALTTNLESKSQEDVRKTRAQKQLANENVKSNVSSASKTGKHPKISTRNVARRESVAPVTGKAMSAEIPDVVVGERWQKDDMKTKARKQDVAEIVELTDSSVSKKCAIEDSPKRSTRNASRRKSIASGSLQAASAEFLNMAVGEIAVQKKETVSTEGSDAPQPRANNTSDKGRKGKSVSKLVSSQELTDSSRKSGLNSIKEVPDNEKDEFVVAPEGTILEQVVVTEREVSHAESASHSYLEDGKPENEEDMVTICNTNALQKRTESPSSIEAIIRTSSEGYSYKDDGEHIKLQEVLPEQVCHTATELGMQAPQFREESPVRSVGLTNSEFTSSAADAPIKLSEIVEDDVLTLHAESTYQEKQKERFDYVPVNEEYSLKIVDVTSPDSNLNAVDESVKLLENAEGRHLDVAVRNDILPSVEEVHRADHSEYEDSVEVANTNESSEPQVKTADDCFDGQASKQTADNDQTDALMDAGHAETTESSLCYSTKYVKDGSVSCTKSFVAHNELKEAADALDYSVNENEQGTVDGEIHLSSKLDFEVMGESSVMKKKDTMEEKIVGGRQEDLDCELGEFNVKFSLEVDEKEQTVGVLLEESGEVHAREADAAMLRESAVCQRKSLSSEDHFNSSCTSPGSKSYIPGDIECDDDVPTLKEEEAYQPSEERIVIEMNYNCKNVEAVVEDENTGTSTISQAYRLRTLDCDDNVATLPEEKDQELFVEKAVLGTQYDCKNGESLLEDVNPGGTFISKAYSPRTVDVETNAAATDVNCEFDNNSVSSVGGAKPVPLGEAVPVVVATEDNSLKARQEDVDHYLRELSVEAVAGSDEEYGEAHVSKEDAVMMQESPEFRQESLTSEGHYGCTSGEDAAADENAVTAPISQAYSPSIVNSGDNVATPREEETRELFEEKANLGTSHDSKNGEDVAKDENAGTAPSTQGCTLIVDVETNAEAIKEKCEFDNNAESSEGGEQTDCLGEVPEVDVILKKYGGLDHDGAMDAVSGCHISNAGDLDEEKTLRATIPDCKDGGNAAEDETSAASSKSHVKNPGYVNYEEAIARSGNRYSENEDDIVEEVNDTGHLQQAQEHSRQNAVFSQQVTKVPVDLKKDRGRNLDDLNTNTLADMHGNVNDDSQEHIIKANKGDEIDFECYVGKNLAENECLPSSCISPGDAKFEDEVARSGNFDFENDANILEGEDAECLQQGQGTLADVGKEESISRENINKHIDEALEAISDFMTAASNPHNLRNEDEDATRGSADLENDANIAGGGEDVGYLQHTHSELVDQKKDTVSKEHFHSKSVSHKHINDGIDQALEAISDYVSSTNVAQGSSPSDIKNEEYAATVELKHAFENLATIEQNRDLGKHADLVNEKDSLRQLPEQTADFKKGEFQVMRGHANNESDHDQQNTDLIGEAVHSNWLVVGSDEKSACSPRNAENIEVDSSPSNSEDEGFVLELEGNYETQKNDDFVEEENEVCSERVSREFVGPTKGEEHEMSGGCNVESDEDVSKSDEQMVALSSDERFVSELEAAKVDDLVEEEDAECSQRVSEEIVGLMKGDEREMSGGLDVESDECKSDEHKVGIYSDSKGFNSTPAYDKNVSLSVANSRSDFCKEEKDEESSQEIPNEIGEVKNGVSGLSNIFSEENFLKFDELMPGEAVRSDYVDVFAKEDMGEEKEGELDVGAVVGSSQEVLHELADKRTHNEDEEADGCQVSVIDYPIHLYKEQANASGNDKYETELSSYRSDVQLESPSMFQGDDESKSKFEQYELNDWDISLFSGDTTSKNGTREAFPEDTVEDTNWPRDSPVSLVHSCMDREDTQNGEEEKAAGDDQHVPEESSHLETILEVGDCVTAVDKEQMIGAEKHNKWGRNRDEDVEADNAVCSKYFDDCIILKENADADSKCETLDYEFSSWEMNLFSGDNAGNADVTSVQNNKTFGETFETLEASEAVLEERIENTSNHAENNGIATYQSEDNEGCSNDDLNVKKTDEKDGNIESSLSVPFAVEEAKASRIIIRVKLQTKMYKKK